MPYSVKSRPHLPHGCIPTPSTITSSRTLMLCPPAAAQRAGRPPLDKPRSCRLPRPHEPVALVVGVEDGEGYPHRLADRQVGGRDAADDLAEHDDPFACQFDGGDG